jgi:hypothetical protein
MITIETTIQIQIDHLDEVVHLIDVYKRKMIETKRRSKTLEWLFYVALHLLLFAIALGIHMYYY